MSRPIIPPADSPLPSDYASVADEAAPLDAALLAEEETDEDGEAGKDGKSDGKSGGKKPSSKKDYDVILDPLFSYEDDELPYEESLLKKVGLLMLAPFSSLVPGASAMAAENDLSRRLFMGNLGLHSTKDSRDLLADPDMIKKLDQKQRSQMQREGIAHPDAVSSGAGAAAVALALGALTRSDDGAAKSREHSQSKAQKESVKKDLSSRVEDEDSMSLDGDDGFDAPEFADFSVPDLADIPMSFDEAQDAPTIPAEPLSYADTVEIEERPLLRPAATLRVMDADFSLQQVFDAAVIALQEPAQTVSLDQQIDFTPKNPGLSR